ncbi:PQQ-dependent sugar dehydrogenase [Luteolibacter marinus]|uniref:PQQ-dependent sugar dehydrogenase n=1 Tax=Luteolibacter marinus TaxID=2776705 RepID=UPI001865EF2B|nr:PQQ-dependent sugar dehydrogenase [Luteolibacter marinus]
MTVSLTPPRLDALRATRRAVPGALFAIGVAVSLPSGAAVDPVVAQVEDWAMMPFSGDVSTASGNPGYMARVNFLREEPGGSGRMWVCDLNGNLHIFSLGGTAATRSAQLLDQAHQRTAYLDFNGQAATTNNSEKTNVPDAGGTSTTRQAPDGLFPLFTKRQGFANGLVTFEFDPGYPANGRFYTVHIEAVSPDGDPGRLPVTTKFPGFNAAGYASTPVVNPAGSTTRQAVLIEWTDTNTANLTFEGTARELLRIGYNSHIHPLGDLTFDPTAQPGSAEWGVMYLASGDGAAGESNATGDDGIGGLTAGDRHFSPQRLDSLVGKILRIIPDLSLHPETSTLSANGRYRIPGNNPFTDQDEFPGARPEVWTVGHRNPHRFAWQVPAGQPSARRLMVEEIGLNTWEEVNIITRGANYGYADREGPQKLTISTSSSNQTVGPLPVPDTLPLRINGGLTGDPVAPVYPVVTYPHSAAYGDAISSGFIYTGSAIPALQEKYVFGDITTGRLFFCEFEKMLAANDGDPSTTAAIHVLPLRWDDPHDAPDAGPQGYSRMFEIVEAGYDFRGGVDSDLPGGASISGSGRADIRLAIDSAGELYVTSKSDGMIRKIVAAPAPQFTSQPADVFAPLGSDADFHAAAVGNAACTYRWQRLTAGADQWEDLADNAVFSGSSTGDLHLDNPGYEVSGDRFRCVATSDEVPAVSSAASLELRSLSSTWLNNNFSAAQRADYSISGDLADPDHDRLVNLVEYGFGFDPWSDSSSSIPSLVRSGGNVSVTFPAPRSSLNYAVEVSGDLDEWTTDGVSLSGSGGNKTGTYPISSASAAYLRIAVTPK